MNRLRFTLVAVAILVAIPIGLLVSRALTSITIEEERNHETVAEQAFTLMSRELGTLLQREDARPVGHYRSVFVPEGALRGSNSLARSPLADGSEYAYISGYFQIDPDGTVQSPFGLTTRTSTREFNDDDSTLQRYAESILEAETTEGRRAEHARNRGLESQLGGTTIPVGKKARQRKKQAPSSPSPQSAVPVPESRAKSAPGRGWSQGPTANKAILQEEADVFANKEDAAMVQQVRRRAASLEGGDVAGMDLESVALGDLEKTESEAPAPGEQIRAAVDATVDLTVSPLNGLLIDERNLLLHRIVSLDGRLYRQGIIVNLAALKQHLSSLVLERSHESPLTLTWDVSTTAPPLPSDAVHAYRHRFAQPFGSLWASIEVSPLPGLRGRNYILMLFALLVIFAALGLLAVHRMVSVSLSFAERRNNFVSAVSHELKTPLTAIRMYAEMLRDGMVPTDEKKQQYHETITTESERLSRLVDNVLELSRLEHGERAMNLRSDAIGPVISEAIETFGIHAKAKGFTLEFESEPNLPKARFDRDALLQVVLNLIDNAIKYAHDAEDRRITLSTGARDGKVILSVRDRGPGVSTKHVKHIFDPFYRGENELTRRTKGTGIGLALVAGLVERMNGTVMAENTTPTGFRVDITLST